MTNFEKAAAIHASVGRGFFVCTGGGCGLLSTLLSVPGASQTVLEARVPYSAEAMTSFLGRRPEQFCSEPTARRIAAMAWIMWPAIQAGSKQAQLEALQRSQGLTLPALILMAVPGAIAALRYALSEYIMAEKPETGILACIRRSKAMMQNQKRNLFLLLFSFLLWYLAELLVASMLTGVLSFLVQMLAGLALNVYMACSVCAFYLRLEEAEQKHENPDAEPEPEELN